MYASNEACTVFPFAHLHCAILCTTNTQTEAFSLVLDVADTHTHTYTDIYAHRSQPIFDLEQIHYFGRHFLFMLISPNNQIKIRLTKDNVEFNAIKWKIHFC